MLVEAVASVAAVVVGIPVAYLVWEYLHRRSYGDYNKLPCPPIYPVIGTAYVIPSDRTLIETVVAGHTIKYRNKYGAYAMWMGTVPVLQPTDPAVNQKIMSSSKHTTKGFFYTALRPWLGLGLLTSEGQMWHDRRHMITPSFHFSILNGFSEVMSEQASIMVQQLAKEADTGRYFDIFHYITLCALDIIMETAMGVSIGAQVSGEENDYVKAVYKMTNMLAARSLKPWLLFEFILNMTEEGRIQKEQLAILHGFTDRVIKERRQTLDVDEAKTKRRLAFLDMIMTATLPNGSLLNDAEVREEVDTFMFEGHDTTSASAVWSLYYLAMYPDIQQKVYEELVEVLGESDSINVEQAGKLKYLDMVTKETLRLRPSVSAIIRTLTEDLHLDDLVIPAGTGAQIRIWEMNRDPLYWEEPEKFDPERWTSERTKNMHPFLYVPFSAGPRNCVGQKFALLEDKIMVGKIVKNFRLEFQTGTHIKCLPDLVLRPENGMPVRIFKR